mmetsp:Transcript_29742/g.53799  ORF Transcript_29742/g.53799 Transcript_29742/m.53799 type:complete len:332 (+) Transcript_29742:259-1254(+)|eukprot:CAMPEP_0202498414 /NCGR_PEP_ID=MMETSP1361-20130828/25922_1 /ASSEMBLY_ACC=CAM_ASM_000849 /TAXON_ID=210615 /ORGANISM="Staurosira complex sp., Strain CCMP2646" /LENGTH=331 /DNA_ID=CAMNT_0049130305 /DNA_START=160 /DNA_END=1155 /DNA_ORIENTATION=-
MSTAQLPAGAKKAVHVKWAGKTIALGTFPAAEADEKCARAKALTRAWRSTMRPKPSREWVMLELERLNVRVVSGRLSGRKDDGEDGEGGNGDRKASIGWTASGDDFDSMMQQRRSSSIGFGGNRNSMGMGGDEASRRPFVGGGSAAAYEAARADHYGSMGGKGGPGASGSMGMTINPNQHYEMLKLHHMNLLNEIQETTLMMNLYQQQQLQQQQEQLSREGAVSDTQGSGSTGMFASSGEGQRISTSDSPGKADELATAQEQQQELEERLRKIKEDIATKQKEAEDVEEKEEADKDEGSTKRKADKDDESSKKRAKTDKEGKKDARGKSKK